MSRRFASSFMLSLISARALLTWSITSCLGDSVSQNKIAGTQVKKEIAHTMHITGIECRPLVVRFDEV